MTKEIEMEFRQTTKILFGIDLTDLDSYSEWLGKRVPLPTKGISKISGKDVWVPPSLNYLNKPLKSDQLFSLDEMQKLPGPSYTQEDFKGKNLMQMAQLIKTISFVAGNYRYQENENVENSSGAGGGRNLYYCEDVYLNVKNIAYSNYALYCQNSFGCHRIMHSSFCIHAYDSTLLNRCFEVENCSNSSDLLFCHNCENVRDSMFCFNAKNLKNAIGNVELPLDKYKTIKKIILGNIIQELKQNKKLKFDIFSLSD